MSNTTIIIMCNEVGSIFGRGISVTKLKIGHFYCMMFQLMLLIESIRARAREV